MAQERLIHIGLCRLLIGGLFNKKEEQKDGDAHPLDDTLKRLLSKLQVYHTISRPTPTVPLLSSLLTRHSGSPLEQLNGLPDFSKPVSQVAVLVQSRDICPSATGELDDREGSTKARPAQQQTRSSSG